MVRYISSLFPALAAAAPGNSAPAGADDEKTVLMSELRWTPGNNPPFALSLGTFISQRAGQIEQEKLAGEKLDVQWLQVKEQSLNKLVNSWLLYTTGDCQALDCTQRLQGQLAQRGLSSQIIKLPPPAS